MTGIANNCSIYVLSFWLHCASQMYLLQLVVGQK